MFYMYWYFHYITSILTVFGLNVLVSLKKKLTLEKKTSP